MVAEGVVLPVPLAAALAVRLRQWVTAEARENGQRVGGELLWFLDACDGCRRAVEATEVYNNSSTARELLPVEAFNTKQAARVLGCTVQNISARCRRGSLDAHMDSGKWVIYL